MRKHAPLDLPGRAQFLRNAFPIILLFHPLPLHPADGIHLFIQSLACPVDLLMHRFKFAYGKESVFYGLQVSLPHAFYPIKQCIELTHKPFQP